MEKSNSTSVVSQELKDLEKTNMQFFSLSILAPERRFIEGEKAVSLLVTTTEGEIEILPGHANLVAILGTGRFSYTIRGEKTVSGVISSGFLNVEDGSVKVVAETIELATEIDLARAKGAQVRAENELKKNLADPILLNKNQLKLKRAIIRQEVGTH